MACIQPSWLANVRLMWRGVRPPHISPKWHPDYIQIARR